eukprot:765638-Hanusia_phi.AAC.1
MRIARRGVVSTRAGTTDQDEPDLPNLLSFSYHSSTGGHDNGDNENSRSLNETLRCENENEERRRYISEMASKQRKEAWSRVIPKRGRERERRKDKRWREGGREEKFEDQERLKETPELSEGHCTAHQHWPGDHLYTCEEVIEMRGEDDEGTEGRRRW